MLAMHGSEVLWHGYPLAKMENGTQCYPHILGVIVKFGQRAPMGKLRIHPHAKFHSHTPTRSQVASKASSAAPISDRPLQYSGTGNSTPAGDS